MQVNGGRTHVQGEDGAGRWMVHRAGDHSDGERVTVALNDLTVSHATPDQQKCCLHPSPGETGEVHESLTPGQGQ